MYCIVVVKIIHDLIIHTKQDGQKRSSERALTKGENLSLHVACEAALFRLIDVVSEDRLEANRQGRQGITKGVSAKLVTHLAASFIE